MDKKNLQHTILESAYNREVWLDVLKEFFGAKKILQQPKRISVDSNKAEYAVELGSFYTADEKLVGIFEVKLMPLVWIERNRVGLRSLLRQVYKYDVDGALIVFVQDNKWRFSYVSEIRTEEGKKETEPKRYTYLFGKGESCRTAAERFDKLKGKPVYLNDLYEAFSVEKLNKDFFKTYKEFNEKFWNYLAENKSYYKILYDNRKEIKDDEVKKTKPIRDFSKKLLGRIVFLHFLQKKGWMGVPLGSKEWKNGDPKFLQNLFANCKDKSTFHSRILKVLFFKTLNTKRANDIAPTLLGKDIKIPYLNGGLFDKDISFENDFDFPEEMFAKLLDFFEQYNFTIDENDPYDSEVGIDPEMLGHIFENLLEENREKGAFYTPKEIVHYMCQESLLQYLRTHLPECTEDESPATLALQNFIRKGETGDRTDRKNFVVQQAKRIERLLDNVKICDPAIGSGAFPMGMLQEIFKAKTALDLTLDHTEVKKQIIQNCIYGVDIENGAVEIARLRFWLALVVDETEPQPLPNLDYKIMQGNSLLESFEGVDLSKLAEDEVDDSIVFANKNQFELGAEFSSQRQSLLMFDQKSKTKLYELIDDYFNYDETSNTKYKSKQFIKDEINNIVEGKLIAKFYLQKPKVEQKIKDIQNNLKANRLMAADAPGIRAKKEKNIEKLNRELQAQETELEKLNDIIEHLHELQTRTDKPYFLWHLWFKEVFDKGGFDIVIGNPPYIKERDNAHIFKEVNESDLGRKWHQGKMDYWFYFLHKSIDISNKKSIITFITSRYWLNSQGAQKLIQRIINELSFTNVVDIGKLKVFDNVAGHHMIAIYSKVKHEAFQYKKLEVNISEIERQHETDNLKIRTLSNRDVFKNDNIIFDEEIFSTNNSSLLLGDLYDTSIGVQESPDKISSKQLNESPSNDINIGDGVFVLTEEEAKKLKLSKEEQNILKPYLDPNDVERYFVNIKKKKYLIYSDKVNKVLIETDKRYSNLKRRLDKYRNYITSSNGPYGLHRPRSEEYFTEPKIVFKGMFVEPEFAYDIEKNYLGFSFSSIIQKNKSYSLKYLLAIINSKFARKWFYSFGKKRGAGVDIGVEKLRLFPINENKFPVQIETLVNKIIDLKKEKLPTSYFENKIDALVFHLYGLSESEMLQVLDTFKDLSIKDRNQIQNEYWNIANNKFKTEV